MLLGVARDRHDDAGRARDPPEPVGHRALRPDQRPLRGLEDLVGVVEAEARVVAQRGQGALEVRRPQDAAAELHELAVDPLDLGEPRGVDLLGLQLERGVDPDERLGTPRARRARA